MPDPLDMLRKAHMARRRGEERYRAALLAAVAGGYTYADIARELSISRQSVRKMALRGT